MRSKTRSPFHRPANGLQIENSGDEANVMVYDEIGFWGVTSKDFITALDGISARTINLHINSPGGDVFEGLAIVNAIRSHSARVVTHVDALAASIASIIALAGDRVLMADNAFLMIHDPWCLMMGNSDDLRKQADLLDKIGGSIVGEYVKKSGQPEDKIKQLMKDETWFSAKDALDIGFIDKIEHEQKDDAVATAAAYDLSIFKNAPVAFDRDDDAEPTVRELEHALRDAGMSRSQARQLVAAGLPALQKPRDEAPESLLSAAQQLIKTMSTR